MATPLRVVALLFPNVTQLDLMGPVQVFSHLPDATVDLVWHRLEPVSTDAGFSVQPTTTFADAPQADVLTVPGGQGAFDLLDDASAIAFIRRQALGARYVTSVCTGAFPLGAAGLIDGKRATTHWASHSMLSEFGAIPEQRRVVQDGNVITAGGVTSGIDFALSVAAELHGADTARAVQLALEYDPHPPFDAGTPTRPEADPDQVARTIERSHAERGPVVARAAARRRIESLRVGKRPEPGVRVLGRAQWRHTHERRGPDSDPGVPRLDRPGHRVRRGVTRVRTPASPRPRRGTRR